MVVDDLSGAACFPFPDVVSCAHASSKLQRTLRLARRAQPLSSGRSEAAPPGSVVQPAAGAFDRCARRLCPIVTYTGVDPRRPAAERAHVVVRGRDRDGHGPAASPTDTVWESVDGRSPLDPLEVRAARV